MCTGLWLRGRIVTAVGNLIGMPDSPVKLAFAVQVSKDKISKIDFSDKCYWIDSSKAHILRDNGINQHAMNTQNLSKLMFNKLSKNPLSQPKDAPSAKIEDVPILGAQAASVGLATAIDKVNKEMKDLLSTTNFTQ